MEMVTIDKICIFLQLSSAVLGLEHGDLQICRRSSVMPVFEFKLLLQMKRHHCTIPNV